MVSLSIRREAAAAEICEPAPQIRQDIAELIDTWACLANQPCHKEKIDRAKSLLQNDPDDFLLNRTYQNLVFDLPERDRQTAIGEMLVPYRKKARRIPDDPAVQYLNKGFEQDPEKARARDERFVKKWPGFSWGRLDLAVDVLKSRTWGNDPHDREIGEEHLAIFMRLCPTRYVEALGLMMSDLAFNGGNPAFLREHLPRLRATVEAAPPARTLAYGALWNLEFASALPTDQPRVRSRVKGDLASLKKLRLKSNLNWLTLLR